ncbi:MAG TPA: M20/M25/M40 family metallo-hydrolase [Blastocatellia bacterium]|nr:M20/M25/M40 family metallo-hydrolase [Blastocatellia bacterium]
MNVFDLTKQLISIPSISGEEEAIADFLADYLQGAGFSVQKQLAAERRPNVYAYRGEPDVVLSTHTDTVPPYIEWREDEHYIYGRGACDTKGLMAAMLKAAEKLVETNTSDFGLLFVVGEEAGSVGARVANTIPNKCRYLINGEPTESKLALGSKGSLKVVVRAKGRAAHSAYPELGESAIEKLIDVLNDIRTARLPQDKTLGATTVNFGFIRGGIASNVIPPDAEFEMMIRVVSDLDSLKNMIEQIIGERAKVEYTFECGPVFTERLEGFETAVVSFTTDIPKLTNWGKPVLFGPGSILDAHTDNERISKTELAAAVDAYAEMVVRLKSSGQ